MKFEIMFTTVCIDINSKKKNYLDHGKKLIESVLNNSKYKILVLTNDVDYFHEYVDNNQVIIESTILHDYPTHLSEKKYFNMHTKRKSIELASNHGSEYIIYLDGDAYLTSKWDDNLSIELFRSLDGDIYVNRIYNLMGKNVSSEKKGETFRWKEVMGDLWDDEKFGSEYAPQETHIVIKNNDKYKEFNDFWKKIENESFKREIRTDFIGYPIACSITHSKMKKIYYSKIWTEYFEGFKLNNLGKETRIVSF
jgi:hypothetical protein